MVESLAFHSTTYYFVLNQRVSQQAAERYCSEHFEGAVLANVTDTSLLYALDFKLVDMKTRKLLSSPTNINELWIGGKTNIGQHQQIDISSNPIGNAGEGHMT